MGIMSGKGTAIYIYHYRVKDHQVYKLSFVVIGKGSSMHNILHVLLGTATGIYIIYVMYY